MKREEWMDFLEPDTADLLAAENCLEKRRNRKKIPGKKWLALAVACMLLAALSTAVLASQGNKEGILFSWFQVTDTRERQLLGEMALEAEACAQDKGFTIQVKEAVSDGQGVYAVLEITAPQTVSLKDVYSLDLKPMLLNNGEDPAKAEVLRGGWYTSVLDWPEQNILTVLVSVEPAGVIAKKNLLLNICRIVEIKDGQDRTLAQGNWDLTVPVPGSVEKSVRQWTKISCGGEDYYVTKVKMTPLGVSISAVKKIPLSVLGKTAYWKWKEMTGTKDAVPGGWSKASFDDAGLTVKLKDGGIAEIVSGGSSGRLAFCERNIRWQGIVDPEEIEEIRMGDTTLGIK